MIRFAAAGAGMLIATSAMGQVVMEFDAFEIDNNMVNDIGTSISEDGFTISQDPNDAFPFAVFGQQENRYPGSAAPFNNTVDGLIRLEQDNGNAFDLISVDFAPLNSATPVTINFTGFLPGGGTVTDSFTHSGSAIALETHTFGNDFDNVTAVEWTQASPFHQFDNVTIVPAPGAMALLGLGGLAATRRRR